MKIHIISFIVVISWIPTHEIEVYRHLPCAKSTRQQQMESARIWSVYSHRKYQSISILQNSKPSRSNIVLFRGVRFPFSWVQPLPLHIDCIEDTAERYSLSFAMGSTAVHIRQTYSPSRLIECQMAFQVRNLKKQVPLTAVIKAEG